jgi:methylated-DNA-[protein]-cysteine S-methyltransferase
MKAYDRAETVFFDFIPRTPVGSVLIGATRTGLCALTFGRISKSSTHRILERMFPSAAIEYNPTKLRRYRREIEGYFHGTVKRFTVPVDLREIRSPFRRSVLIACMKIPFGRTATYGALAARAGSPRAARAVGGAMAANPIPIVVPCHRVVASQGKIGGYTGGIGYKKLLLSHEGIHFD